MISFEEFNRVDIRSGRIVKVKEFLRAKKPAFKIRADFGSEIGVLQTSAQVTANYTIKSLMNRLIVVCVNWAEKNVAGFLSQFLLLGFSDENGTTCLIASDLNVPNGQKLN
ncbi:MAG: tRNA-binding protein [Rickettsia endosymbiont of Bryobia graminum]|nr:tRNA-binding protein [Rickettsia endosymbiont of Bryobia graminum]